MKLTIIVDDKSVGVDDVFCHPVDISELDESIHAVQWYGSYGEIEYKTFFENGSFVKRPNEFISSLDPFLFVVPRWETVREKSLRIAPPTIASGQIPVTEVFPEADVVN